MGQTKSQDLLSRTPFPGPLVRTFHGPYTASGSSGRILISKIPRVVTVLIVNDRVPVSDHFQVKVGTCADEGCYGPLVTIVLVDPDLDLIRGYPPKVVPALESPRLLPHLGRIDAMETNPALPCRRAAEGYSVPVVHGKHVARPLEDAVSVTGNTR